MVEEYEYNTYLYRYSSTNTPEACLLTQRCGQGCPTCAAVAKEEPQNGLKTSDDFNGNISDSNTNVISGK